MQRLLRLALVASVLYGTGTHWAALQGAAWGGMLAARVSESSLAEAVSSTFSGAKPCHVCKIVEKGSASGRSSSFLRSGPNVEFAFAEAPLLSAVALEFSIFVPPSTRACSSSSRPVVPPPKIVLPA